MILIVLILPLILSVFSFIVAADKEPRGRSGPLDRLIIKRGSTCVFAVYLGSLIAMYIIDGTGRGGREPFSSSFASLFFGLIAFVAAIVSGILAFVATAEVVDGSIASGPENPSPEKKPNQPPQPTPLTRRG